MSTLQRTGLVFNDWSAMVLIRTVIEDNGDECAVCLGPIVCGEYVSELSACGHTFHMACIVRWFTVKLQGGAVGCCPLCNAQIVQPGKMTPMRFEDTPPRFEDIPPIFEDIPPRFEDIPVLLHLTSVEDVAHREAAFRRTAKIVFVVVVTCFALVLILLDRY
jgi:hypothetical protein